ncbi:class I SAM-dependent DNA methyltransferase [Sphingomonas sp. RS6]
MTIDEFIAKWQVSGGNERANTQLFVSDLCHLLGVEPPQPTLSDTQRNDYVFERHVIKNEIDAPPTNGWIDCYKRDCFILEAKQGSAADIAAVDAGENAAMRDFFGQTAIDRFKRGMAKRGTGQWTGAMQRAASQAEGYAKNLPRDHGWPPFLLVTDVGYCIDVYADFQRSGKGYAPFPDRRRYRITLDDLRDAEVRKRLAAVWTTPMALDPSAEAARVTREIATLLAELAKDIEAREQNADRVAAFLMRLLFTMFAEDTGLIPKKSFSALLKKTRERPELLPQQLSQLWEAMDKGGLAFGLGEAGETVRRFNGYLFKDTTALPVTSKEIDILIAAAAADWRQVEPAIFGTLLERALNTKERAKLGAHYTPRAYVERLVGPTILEPLRADWEGARTAATLAAEAGEREEARRIVETFHTKLAATKVLDPACGTGNFLYVAMARMKELEGEVLELLDALGDERYLAELEGHTITPENFLGIEINPRAAAIAQLVLWIGYLQWHFRVNGEDRMPEPPVLRDVRTIENRDALIEWDRRELERDANGVPVTRWDGETMKLHPVTGKPVPDESARVELYRYVNPRAAKWPKADFIVGNPPFIGNKRMRDRLGDGYFLALRRSWPKVPGDADFVMYWWFAAALRARGSVRRFGFITTNSINQASSRAVIETAMHSIPPVSLVFAVPDHPWVDPETDAAVRVAMTAAEVGVLPGRVLSIIAEARADGYGDSLKFQELRGRINADLRIGANVPSARPLRSNMGVSFMGMIPLGSGFRVMPTDFESLQITSGHLSQVVKPYLNGRALTRNEQPEYVIDLFGLSAAEVERRYPVLFQHLLNTVKPFRQQSKRASYRDNWWYFGEPRPAMRKALVGMDRYIATTETARHRIFSFIGNHIVPDQKIRVLAFADALILGILSSKAHVLWADAAGARQGVGNDLVYNTTTCFDPFPFPDTSDEALKARIRDAAERLDALRKDVLARHDDLTLTKLYNVLEALRAAERAGTVLGPKDRDIAERGCVSLIRQYHDAIDAGVAEAYGWPVDLSDADILERLVALNKERAAEEARGKVRWLRPDFQAPGYQAPAEQAKLALDAPQKARAEALEWPGALPDQVVAVASVVARSARPVAANDVARAFKGKRATSVLPVLDALAGMGRLRKLEDGRYAA